MPPLESRLKKPLTYSLREIGILLATGEKDNFLPGIEKRKNIALQNLIHYSDDRIAEFTQEGATKVKSGKFGSNAAYFAGGELKGETFDSYKEDPSKIKHVASITGDFLVIKRSQVLDLEEQLKGKLDLQQSSLRRNIQNANLTDLLHVFNPSIDGIIVINEEQKSCEVIVQGSSSSKIKV